MNKFVNISSALSWAKQQFQHSQNLLDGGSDSLDAELLLSHSLNKPRTYLLSWPEATLDTEQQTQFEKLVQRRAQGEPIAYLLAQREFWDLNLTVTTDTLIPRPETELLVETALELIPLDQSMQIADLGTGSGAIALALAKHRPRSHVTAVDNSTAALVVASKNALQNKISNVSFLHSNWFEQLSAQTFQIIVSNPPYVAQNDPHLQRGDVAFEPREALIAGPDGLDDLIYLIAHSMRFLASNGYLIVEHGYNQGNAVAELFKLAGWKNIKTIQDLSQQDRVTIGQWLT